MQKNQEKQMSNLRLALRTKKRTDRAKFIGHFRQMFNKDWRPIEKDIMPAHLGKINLSTWTILSFTSSLRWPKGTYIETKKFWVWLDMLNYATQLKIFLWVITMCNELEGLYWLPAEILMINESCNLLVQDHFGDTILVTQSETVIWRCSSK